MHVNTLPGEVAELCATLGALRGVEAVTLGGSRAAGTADDGSDWDLGVYYRGTIDLAPLARYGEVHPPGAWGRLMNGGAWLRLGAMKVDVLLRDLDVVLHWCDEARRGVYEVDALHGYLAGVPTYSLMAELALNRPVHGPLPEVDEYPAELSRAGARRWPFHADFSLQHARMRAERGDVAGTMGQAAKAVMETAHAVTCRQRTWVLNEKKLVERAGLEDVQRSFIGVPASATGLLAWVEALRTRLRVAWT
jgi:hypothetical protein